MNKSRYYRDAHIHTVAVIDNLTSNRGLAGVFFFLIVPIQMTMLETHIHQHASKLTLMCLEVLLIRIFVAVG